MNKDSVLLYGNGNTLKQNICWINQVYDVVGITGNDVLYNSNDKVFVEVEALKLNYDKILITSFCFEEIKNHLIEVGVEATKIIFFMDEWKIERRMSFGTKNSNITFLVYRPSYCCRTNGFMAFFSEVVFAFQYAKNRNYELVVDMKNYYTNYLSDEIYGQVNIWEYYFLQPSDYSLEEIYESENVILSATDNGFDTEKYLGINMQGNVTTKEDNDKYIDACCVLRNKCGKSFKLSEGLHKRIIEEKKRLGFADNVLGVIARGTDYIYLKPKGHPIPCENRFYIGYVKDIMIQYGFDKIFLATEDSDVLNMFKSEFNSDKLMYTEQRRYSKTGNIYIGNIKAYEDKDGYRRGMEYNAVIAILSECGGLISNCCCWAPVGAIIQNKCKYRYLEVLYNGVYC